VTLARRLQKWARWVSLLLLLVLWARLLHTTAVKSDTFDEILHVLQGVLYWQPEPLRAVVQNPPLVNAIIGVPVSLLFDPALPLDHPGWATGDWLRVSQYFAWTLNSNGLQLIWTGRLAITLLTLLLAALSYRWAVDLTGRRGIGLLVLFLVSFDPNLLAHGHLATTDVGTTFFLLLAAYLVWRFWQAEARRGWLYLAAGLAVGAALAAKFSGLVLLPALFLMALYRKASGAGRQQGWGRALAEPLGWTVLGGLVLLAVYRFDPGALQADFVAQQAHQFNGHSAFLAGQLSTEGWWYYLPFVFAIKTPLPLLALLGAALLLWLWRRDWEWQQLWPLLVAAGVGGAGLVSRVNIGYRYLLPMLPLLYLFIAQRDGLLRPRSRVAGGVVVVLLLWFVVESVAIDPDYLAYFNQTVGGPANGWRYVVDSNVDWGQDIQALGTYLRARDVPQPVRVAWLGSAPLGVYGVEGTPLPVWPVVNHQNPLYNPFYPPQPAPGTYVLSATQLQGAYLQDPDYFGWFRDREPTDRVGYSLFVYEVAAEGAPARVALAGIGMEQLAPADFAQAFAGNDVRPAWYDARRSVLWPGGGGDAPWAAVGDGHWPTVPALQAFYPDAPVLRGAWEDDAGQTWRYRLVRWADSPIAAALAGDLPGLVGTTYTDLGWAAAPVVGSDAWETARQPLPGPALFGAQWQLLGYTMLAEEPPAAGEPLALLTYWQVVQEGARPLKLFVHVLDGAGQLVAQDDGLDVRVPGLRAGDSFAQLHTITLPPELPPGRYALQIGVYDAQSLERLTVPVTPDLVVDRVLLRAFTLPAQ
jgi:4-amino-4-deoxy-L-arabinose transferase-like glycosyltransferase